MGLNIKNKTKVMRTILIGLFFIMVFAAAAHAENVTVSLDVTYGQTEARSMLSMINSFRTDSPWQYDASNNKIAVTGLGNLTYDYALERAAMQRAAEIALLFSHTRTDKSSCYTAYTEEGISYYTAAENIAAGQMSAQEVFKAWKEESDSDNYSTQGHRRNMLKDDVTAVGIGHCVYQGRHFWVQEFADPVTDTTAAAANNSLTEKDVVLSSEAVSECNVKPGDGSDEIRLTYGSEIMFPDVQLLVRAMIDEMSQSFFSTCTPVNYGSFTWTVADPSVASLSGGVLKGLKAGNTTLKSTFAGKEVSIDVVVEQQDIANGNIETIQPMYYSGSALTPEATLIVEGVTLLAGTDYTASYTNNTNAGDATVTLTGTGNYKGTMETSFRIDPADISGGQIGSVSKQTYSASQIQPAVQVTFNGKTLTADTDYTVSYSNNTDVGQAEITVNGKGNYTGSLSSSFIIVSRTVSDGKIDPVADQVYTGKAIKPSVKVTVGGNVLKSADYSVKYTNNKKIGKATVTVTGKGNYKGSLKTNFNIVNKKTYPIVTVKAKKKQMVITVSWKNILKSTGLKAWVKKCNKIQVQISTQKKFKKDVITKTIKKGRTKVTVKKLKSKTTYYLRIRYIAKNKHTSWSKVQKIKTK